MDTVTRKNFNKIMRGRFILKSCPKCGCGACISFEVPLYGAESIKIHCKNCLYSIRKQSTSTAIICENTFATPITFNNIVRALFEATSEWNKERAVLCSE